jgi:4-diphosphocytidyl-2-C-methyl-D-erythritol kinase
MRDDLPAMTEFLAPAKINLSLRVLRRREDGFHEIESLMVPVSLFDRISIDPCDEGGLEFSCSDAAIPADGANLVVRAARLFCTEIGLEPHLRIHLEKSIPHGAGLGGGSSDAAITLLALDRLFKTELPEPTLLSLAADLGSDVPFFIGGRPALVAGRGEALAPSDFSERLPLLLVKPPFGVPTPWAYQRWAAALEIPGIAYAEQRLPWGVLVNDLERPVFEKYLFLAELKMWLLAQPEVAGALLSGSGSTLFAVLDHADAATAIGARLAESFGSNLWCHFAETLAPGRMAPPR